jgi:hypothetical protein
MDNMQSKAMVLERIEAERQIWEALLAEVGEERMERPGVNGIWTFKDMMGHLIGWRVRTVDRLNAGVRDEPPVPPPWPADLGPGDEDEAVNDRINAYFYAHYKDRPLADLLAQSRLQFVQMREAVQALSEHDLLTANRFPWLEGWPLVAVITGSFGHLHEDHEPDIRAWLARITPDAP